MESENHSINKPLFRGGIIKRGIIYPTKREARTFNMEFCPKVIVESIITRTSYMQPQYYANTGYQMCYPNQLYPPSLIPPIHPNMSIQSPYFCPPEYISAIRKKRIREYYDS